VIAKNTKRAVFLDRDGVLSPDEFGYISNPELYHLYPWTGEALRILKKLGFLLFVVTNQSGIARGYFKVEDLERVLSHMKSLINAEGVTLDGVFYSPYFKTGIIPPYNVEHEDRKPGIGMFKQAKVMHHFQAQQSWMIGDRSTDILFGQNAGLKTMLLLTGNGTKELLDGFTESQSQPNFICENLLTASRLIERFEL